MKILLSKLDFFIKEYFSPMPSRHKAEFEQEIERLNASRMQSLTYFMIPVAIFVFSTDYLLKDFWGDHIVALFKPLDIGFMIITIFYFVTFNFVFLRDRTENLRLQRWLIYLFPLFSLGWAALISGIEFSFSGMYPAYIISVFVIFSILYFRLSQVLLYMGYSMLVLYLGNRFYSTTHESFNERYIDVIPMLIIAAGLSRVFYIGKRKSYMYEKEITEINSYLRLSKEELDAKVIERTRELIDSNRELQLAKEKAEQSDYLKSAFLANLSHEIRTPMNSILGFIELLRTEKLPPETASQYLEIIHSNGKNLLNIINDIIDISKIEANQMVIVNRVFSLNNMLNLIYITFKLREKSNLALRLHTSLEDKDSFILGDNTRLNQVITNILNNAFKFTKEGNIEFGYVLEDEKTLKFFVKDTGMGISKSKQEIIFERFRQADESYTREFGGAGLGLAISKRLIALMGGKIWVHSEPLKGSVFYFTLPYQPAKHTNPPENEENNKKEHLYKWDNKTILIAEDDPICVDFLRTILLPKGVKVVHCLNGKDAVEECKKNMNINLVLMDIMMPSMNGLQATSVIKKFRRDLPIIAITAYITNEQKERTVEAGCDEFVEKPIIISNLLSVIDNFF